ncbi:MAG: ECF transporter S component [Anaerolineae bacterium]|nr:ECF transporter S component [Anaerolineae bacterium]
MHRESSTQINPRQIALTGVMAALVMALTYFIRIPTPLGGYVHLGDLAINFVALAFGPVAGMVAGGVGTALADVVAGYPLFAIASLIVHGLQGYVVGRIAHGKTDWRVLALAVVAGAAIVVAGYFIAEATFLGYGVGVASTEIVPNIVQGIAGSVGIAVYLAVRRAYPPIARYGS